MPLTTRHTPRIKHIRVRWLADFRKLPLLKKLFWLYFLLLIFEGALRKWVFPQFAGPLLLVRDPVAVWIIWEAFRTKKWPQRWSTVTAILVAFICGLTLLQVMLNDVPWWVAVYGVRSYLLPFPVAFIMGENLDPADMRKFAICTLVLLLPLVALEVAQYRADPSSPLNAGAGLEAHQTTYYGAHARASGTFSYNVGPTSYAPLAAAFIFFGLTSDRFGKRWLLWAATAALILSAPSVGSRAMIFELAEVVVCAAIAALLGASQFVRTLRIVVPIFAVYFLVSYLPVFSQASQTLNNRFNQADAAEGGSVQSSMEMRAFGPIIGAVVQTDFTKNVIGQGLGTGAAAISKVTTGHVSFLMGEYEITRVIGEFGPIGGFSFMLFLYGLALILFISAFLRAREGSPLGLLLFTVLFNSLTAGILEQPTEQGFMVIALAFTLSAVERRRVVAKSAHEVQPLPRPLRYSQAVR